MRGPSVREQRHIEVEEEHSRLFGNERPARKRAPNEPVVHWGSEDDWEQVQAFCRRLSQRTGLSVRLPSETEWEHACRASTATRYSFGNDPEALGDYAWHQGNTKNFGDPLSNSDGEVQPVGLKKPNPLGLYDMHGNVWEWCLDRWTWCLAGAPTDGTPRLDGPLRVVRNRRTEHRSYRHRKSGGACVRLAITLPDLHDQS